MGRIRTQADVVGITIVIRGDAIKFGLVGNPTPELLIEALDIVRKDFLKAIAKHEAEQETKQLSGEDMQELEQS